MNRSIEIASSLILPGPAWKAFFLALALSVSFHAAKAQDLEVGIAGGGSYYLGDLNPGKHFQNTQVSYGVMARYCLDTRWAFKLSGTRGEVKGDAASSWYLPERGLDFSSTLTDISAVAEFNFLPYFTGSKVNSMTPYIFTGFSVFFFDPVSSGVSLRSLGTEGQNIGYQGRKPYSTTGFAIPFGIGGKFSLAKRLSLNVFWEMHKTFTDYLDDVSTTYYLNGRSIADDDRTGLMSDPTRDHDPGMQRGNEKNKDWYAFAGVSLTYKFNLLSSKKCRDLEHK